MNTFELVQDQMSAVSVTLALMKTNNLLEENENIAPKKTSRITIYIKIKCRYNRPLFLLNLSYQVINAITKCKIREKMEK